MAITGVTEKQYKEFVENGGSITFVLDPTDLSPENAFESYTSIKPCLYTGFEMGPTLLIHDPKLAGDVYVHGASWDKVMAYVYRNGGKIIYKKLTSGKFQADCSIPK
jgi:hypothetical protein